jgi:hypothetical protein
LINHFAGAQHCKQSVVCCRVFAGLSFTAQNESLPISSVNDRHCEIESEVLQSFAAFRSKLGSSHLTMR